MTERIKRKGTKRCYQPPALQERIHGLYLLKEQTGIPMTVHMDRALAEYIQNHAQMPEQRPTSKIDA